MTELTTMALLSSLRSGPLERSEIQRRLDADASRRRSMAVSELIRKCMANDLIAQDDDQLVLTGAGRSEVHLAHAEQQGPASEVDGRSRFR
jgi:predicted transcriptional regulator